MRTWCISGLSGQQRSMVVQQHIIAGKKADPIEDFFCELVNKLNDHAQEVIEGDPDHGGVGG